MPKILDPRKYDEPYQDPDEQGVDGCLFILMAIMLIMACYVIATWHPTDYTFNLLAQLWQFLQ